MRKVNVLVVDDEPDSLLALSMTLQLLGYEVSTAQDGLDALQVLAQHRPHVIVTDITMPIMDGTALCFHLKSDPATTRIPIIVYTGLHEIHPALQAHVARFLRKPIDVDELHQAIHLSMQQPSSGERTAVRADNDAQP
jgi:CheY-like chemotaxis protein